MKIHSNLISLSSGFCRTLQSKKVMTVGLIALGLSTLAVGGGLICWALTSLGSSPSGQTNPPDDDSSSSTDP